MLETFSSSFALLSNDKRSTNDFILSLLFAFLIVFSRSLVYVWGGGWSGGSSHSLAAVCFVLKSTSERWQSFWAFLTLVVGTAADVTRMKSSLTTFQLPIHKARAKDGSNVAQERECATSTSQFEMKVQLFLSFHYFRGSSDVDERRRYEIHLSSGVLLFQANRLSKHFFISSNFAHILRLKKIFFVVLECFSSGCRWSIETFDKSKISARLNFHEQKYKKLNCLHSRIECFRARVELWTFFLLFFRTFTIPFRALELSSRAKQFPFDC